jgi:hypothetical protein
MCGRSFRSRTLDITHLHTRHELQYMRIWTDGRIGRARGVYTRLNNAKRNSTSPRYLGYLSVPLTPLRLTQRQSDDLMRTPTSAALALARSGRRSARGLASAPGR